MFPRFASANTPYVFAGDPIAFTDQRAALATIESPPYFQNIRIANFMKMAFSSGMKRRLTAPAFIAHVLRIISLRSLKKVSRIETRRVIAAMKGMKRVVEAGIGSLVCDAMYQQVSRSSSSLMNSSVSVHISAKWPFLAFASFDVQGFKKVLELSFWGYRIPSRHFGSFIAEVSSWASGVIALGAFPF